MEEMGVEEEEEEEEMLVGVLGFEFQSQPPRNGR